MILLGFLIFAVCYYGFVYFVSILSSSPDLVKREYTFYAFNLCCLCLGHVVPKLLSATKSSREKSAIETDL